MAYSLLVLVQRFYSFLYAKSVDPDARVPPLDSALRRIVEPDESYLRANEATLRNFAGHFTLTYNTQVRTFWKTLLDSLNKTADNSR
jgi:hypothetical protein